MKKQQMMAQGTALFTVLVWGTTFIATKVLLTGFSPVEILLNRFVLGYLVMLLIRPRFLPVTSLREELLFFGAGVSGLTFYYLMENIALTFTLASNVSVILSVAPLFTALLSRLVFRGERLRLSFFLGFFLAIAGIAWISFADSAVSLNPIGDVLCLLAAAAWAVYSVLCKKIAARGHSTVLTTRRIFFYGILTMLPCALFMGYHFGPERFGNPAYLGNFLFLGVLASAVCFITWNWTVEKLGPVRSNAYIYLIPVITVAAAAVFLHEPITWSTVGGAVLVLLGLILSEWRPSRLGNGSPTEETAEPVSTQSRNAATCDCGPIREESE